MKNKIKDINTLINIRNYIGSNLDVLRISKFKINKLANIKNILDEQISEMLIDEFSESLDESITNKNVAK